VLRGLLTGSAIATTLVVLGGGPEPAQAAPCPPLTITNSAGNLSIQGTSPCDSDPESFKVSCSGGTVQVEYSVNYSLPATTDTLVACGSPNRITVLGNYGDDVIDLSSVTRAAGFSGITQNTLDGGAGGDFLIGSPLPDAVLGGSGIDVLRLRDGVADTADCGADYDAVESDQAGVDSLVNCEIVDYAPSPAAAAAKKCKKKHRQKHRCKKRHR
jgi:hypothetical protein